MTISDIAKKLFGAKRAETTSKTSDVSTLQGTVVSDSENGHVEVAFDADCTTLDGTNVVSIGTLASLKEGDQAIVMLEGGGVKRPTAIGAAGWGDRIQASIVETNLLIADKADIEDLEAANAHIGNLEADNLTINNRLEVAETSIGTLEAETAKIENLTAEQLEATTAYIEDLTAGNVTAQNIVADHGDFDTVKANAAKVQNLTAQQLEADHATVGNLDANYAQIDLANIANGTITTAMIGDAQINSAKIANGSIENADIKNGTIENAKIKDGTIETAKIKDAAITTAKIGDAQITTAKIGNAAVGTANIKNAAITNALIANNAVSDEKVLNLSANKLTAGTIDAQQIDVTNLHASSLIVDKLNGQPVLGGYTYVPKGSTGYASKNPSQEGWYEMTANGFALSTDTSVDMTKAYYIDGNATLLYDQNYIDGLEEGLNQRIDGAVETFTGDHVPTLNNYPAADWLTDAAKSTHVGDIYFVVNSALTQDGYNYRFAYDNSTSSYMWVLIKDSDVTKALQDITDLQSFESTTTSWINTTDQGLVTIRQNHAALSGVVDKTVKSSTQLWYTKANTTAPSKPTSQVTSTSTAGNAWRVVVPAWNASYPNYYYCWQFELADGTYAWSDVVRDIAMGESQGTSRDAQATADANIKSSVQLWFTKANSTAPAKPTAQVTTNNPATENAWNLAVPTYSSTYPHYFYCYQQQKGDGTYQWSDVVYDKGTTEAMQKAQAALPSSTFTTFQSTTFAELVDEVDEQSSTITQMSERVETVANPNLTPWFSMPLTDVYDATTNPNGYWKRITTHAQIPTYVSNQFHNGSGGWAHIVGNVTSGNPFVRFEPMPISLKPSTKYTFMLEIDGTFASTFTNVVWRLAEGSETDAYDLFGSRAEVTSPNSVTSGTYYRTATTNANFSDAITLSRAYVQFLGTGAVDVYARVSVYEGEYSGPYKPYVPISETVALTNTVNSVKQTADANTASISGLSTVVSNNGLTSTTNITSRASKIEQTLDGFSSTVGAIVDETVVGTNILTGNALNPYNWTVSAPTGASYTKTAYGTAGVKVQFSAISGWEWLYSPAITVESGKKYTLSVEYTVGKDYIIASGRGGYGLSVYKTTPPHSSYDNANTNFIARAQFFETATRVAMKATVTFTASSNTVYLGLNGGQINDGQSGLSFTMDKLTLVENISSRMSSAETSINQTANNVLIKATESDTTAAQGGQHLIQSLINVAPSGVTISADKVNIAGAAIFTSGRLSENSLNNAYDSKGSAAAVQTNLDNLEIGGRNYVLNSEGLLASGLGSASGSRKEYQAVNLGQSYMGVEAGTKVTVSFDLYMTVNTANPYIQVYNTNNKGPKAFSRSETGTGSSGGPVVNFIAAVGSVIDERVSVTGYINDRTSPTNADNWLEFYSNYGTSNWFSISNLKLEKGEKATDWAPAPEDHTAYVDNLKIGGTNLLRHTDTLEDTGWWTHYKTTSVAAGKADPDGGTGAVLVTPETTAWYLSAKKENALLKDVGEEYTASVWLRADTQTTCKICVRYLQSDYADGTSATATTRMTVTVPTTWTKFSVTGTLTTAQTADSFWVGQSTTVPMYVYHPKVEKGVKATDWSASPEDIVAKSQRIYYRTSTTTKPTAPTTWVTEKGDKRAANATTATNWTTKVTSIASGTGASVEKYLYLYTCVQTVSGTGVLTNSEVLLDDTTTVIDGGKIITGSIEANRLSVYDATINKIKAEAIDLTGVQPAGSYATTTALTTETNQRKAQYGTSSTDAATAEKGVTCANFELVAGNELTVKFSAANTSSAAVTLNVNSKGAKNVWVGNAVTSATNQLLWGKNAYITFRYDGTQFQVIGEPRTWYGACTTAEGTAAKTDTTAVTGCVVCKGAKVELAMTNANTAASPTLNIQSTGAKAVYFGNGTSRPTKSGGTSWLAANTCTFTFDGAAWRTQGKTYLDANSIVTGYLSADRIEGGSLQIGKLETDLQTKVNNAYSGSIEYIVGTHGATATNVWTGTTRDASISAGKQIAFYMTSAGTSSAATLNLTLSGGGTTGAKNVRLNNSNVTTHYPQYTVLKLTYDGTYWKCDNYNSDSTQRTKYEVNLAAAEAITNGRVICGTSSGYRNIAANVTFDLGYPLLYAGTAIEKGATTGTLNNNWLTYQNINFSSNGTITSGAAAKMLFLKGTLTGNSFKISASPFLTTAVPSSDDGLAYIPLGLMSSATNGYFESTKDVYGYRNGSFHKLDTVSNYISVDYSGIRIANANPSSATTYQHQTASATEFYVSGKKRQVTNANGLEVFDSDGSTSLAKFGTSARIGKSGGTNVEIEDKLFKMNYLGDNVAEIRTVGLASDETANAGMFSGRYNGGDSVLGLVPMMPGAESFTADDLTTAKIAGAIRTRAAFAGFKFDSSGNVTASKIANLSAVLLPVTLFYNSSSGYGTINLNETVANFVYIEVFGQSNDGEQVYEKVYDPDGKTFTMSVIVGYGTNKVAVKSKRYVANGTQISVSSLGGVGEVEYLFAPGGVDGHSENQTSINKIKIYRVLGLRK